jgi:hypothetical protein
MPGFFKHGGFLCAQGGHSSGAVGELIPTECRFANPSLHDNILRMKTFPWLVLLLVGVLASCAPSTPQQRIARNPAAFQSLTKKQQDLVSQGLISRGMPAQAVVLAWGPPSRRYEGASQGATTQRWDYFGTQAVVTNQFGFGPGWGRAGAWGRCGWGPYGWGDPFWGPDIAYIPYRRATIVFKNEKVDSWEQLQNAAP